MIMMTQRDVEEAEHSKMGEDVPCIQNSATIRCLLSLRNLLYSHGDPVETFTDDLRVVVQLEGPCSFIDAASFIGPDGQGCVYPQDLTIYLNTMMFRCAAQPGLSRVLMSIMDFHGVAIRTRSAKQTCGGPDNEIGWMIGKTVQECLLGHCWEKGSLMIGVDDEKRQMWDDNTGSKSYAMKDAPGVMGDPQRVIKDSDHIIFLSHTSNPQAFNAADYVPAGEKLLNNSDVKKQRDTPEERATALHMLLCGWRPEWSSDMRRFRNRITDIASNLPKGSTVTCINVMPKETFGELIMKDPRLGFKGSIEDGWTCEAFGKDKWVKHFCADPVIYQQVRPRKIRQAYSLHHVNS